MIVTFMHMWLLSPTQERIDYLIMAVVLRIFINSVDRR